VRFFSLRSTVRPNDWSPILDKPVDTAPLRILLVDDHPPVRFGTRSLILQAYPAAQVDEADAAVEVSLEAIRRALSGGVWLPPEVIGKGGDSPPRSADVLRAALPAPITHEALGITRREFDVLRLALNGLTPLKISMVLDINHDNVKRYMSRLYEKFGTANQSSLHAHFAKTGQTLGILRTLPVAGGAPHNK